MNGKQLEMMNRTNKCNYSCAEKIFVVFDFMVLLSDSRPLISFLKSRISFLAFSDSLR